jgi:hypothetical protein
MGVSACGRVGPIRLDRSRSRWGENLGAPGSFHSLFFKLIAPDLSRDRGVAYVQHGRIQRWVKARTS